MGGQSQYEEKVRNFYLQSGDLKEVSQVAMPVENTELVREFEFAYVLQRIQTSPLFIVWSIYGKRIVDVTTDLVDAVDTAEKMDNGCRLENSG